MATASERVYAYLMERPAPLCDDCLAKALGFGHRQQAAAITAALGSTKDFNRYHGSCMDCTGPQKKVIIRA